MWLTPSANSTVMTPTCTMFARWIQPRSPLVRRENRCSLMSKPSRVSAWANVTITYSGPPTAPHASSARVDSVCLSIGPSINRGSPHLFSRRSRRLVQLDRIPVGVVDQNLFATRPDLHLVAEAHGRRCERADECV